MIEDYHLLVDSIKDYAIYMVDVTGNVASWNAGAKRMKGFTEEDIVGKNISVFFTPEDREKNKAEKELRVALDKGRYEEEGWRVRKDGSRFWANIVITPVFNERREHVGYAKITRDLTEKRRSEELYLLLVSQVSEYAIFMMDPQGDILTWNEGAEQIKGYTAHDIIGKNFSIFYTMEDRATEKPRKELEIAIRTGKYEEEGWRVRADGARIWASIVITPIYTDRHIGFAKVTRDLTRRKEMEQLSKANSILEAANKELERFAFTVSHDLKEPLRKVAMFSNLILEDKKKLSAEKKLEYLQKINTSSVRMNSMIEDILNFSTLSQKQHFEKVSLQKIVSEAVELLEGSVEESRAAINYENLPDAIVIPSQMRQLLQNLISNSLKFSRDDVPPVINISSEWTGKEKITNGALWPAEQYIKLQIKDNGIGFDQQYAERIFSLFDRLHGKTAYEGTGIGLAICRKIAENHGGAITAKSEKGEGAEFTVILPA